MLHSFRRIAGVLLALSWVSYPLDGVALPDRVALGVAAEVGNISAIRSWLDEGMDPNTEADRIGTGLMIGAWEGNIALMELFLARGADINRVNRHGEQALQLAAWKGQMAAVKWLLERGASLNRNGKQWSALHYAVFAGHSEVARYLMDKGADINGKAPNGATPIMMAAREGKEDLAKALIEAGADLRPVTDRGDTVLTFAMRNNHLRIAKMVTTSEGYSQAIAAPPKSFGPPIRSQPPTSEVLTLLQLLREAEANGEPTVAIRQALMNTLDRLARERPKPVQKEVRANNAGPNSGNPLIMKHAVPRSADMAMPAKPVAPKLTITASRKTSRERVELLTGDLNRAESPLPRH